MTLRYAKISRNNTEKASAPWEKRAPLAALREKDHGINKPQDETSSRDGGTGRRKGLKIPWALLSPCRFKSGSRQKSMLRKIRILQKLQRNIQRNLLGKDPDYHDPYDDPAEQFYARLYLKYLFEAIASEFPHQRLKVFDLGCHTGRLSIPLAQAGHDVTAIDSSRFHIQRAIVHAREAGVRCHFLWGNGFRKIRSLRTQNFDLVLCTEVLYQIPDFRRQMQKLVQILRPGGVLVTSHRSRFFYLTQALRDRNFQKAKFILTHSEGVLDGSYFNWQTSAELKDIYQKLGVKCLLVRPVGIFTGNGEEGMARLCNLSQMNLQEREELFDIEACDFPEFSDLGRYLLAIGRK